MLGRPPPTGILKFQILKLSPLHRRSKNMLTPSRRFCQGAMVVNEVCGNRGNTSLESIRRWPTARAKEWTQSFLDLARADDNIVAVIAIGSAVRPAVQSADLDLVVICNEPAKVKVKPPIEVDLRAYPSSQVTALIEGRNDLLGWTLMFGKVLFQRNSYWDTVLTSWKDRIPLPSYDTAVKRADKALDRLREMLDLGDQSAASEMALSYLTNLARAELLDSRQYPRSRPELPDQLRDMGSTRLAECLESILRKRTMSLKELTEMLKTVPSCGTSKSIIS